MEDKRQNRNIPVLDELADLINSIDYNYSPEMTKASRISTNVENDLEMKDILRNSDSFAVTSEGVVAKEDRLDYSVVKFGSQCTLRSSQVSLNIIIWYFYLYILF